MFSVHLIGELFDPDEPGTIQQAIVAVLTNLDTYRSRGLTGVFERMFSVAQWAHYCD